MESTLSIVFNEDSVLCALFEPHAKGWQLSDLTVLSGWYDVFLDDFEETLVGSKLVSYVESIASRVKDVRIVLPPSAVLTRYVPYLPADSQKQITELLELEIMQSAPETSVSSYRASFYPMRNAGNHGPVMLAVLNRKSVENTIRRIFLKRGIMDCMFVVRHVCSHSAFLYSFPESAASTTILVNADVSQCDVYVLQKRVTAYFNIIPYTDAQVAPEAISQEILGSILPVLVSVPEEKPSVMLCGDAITPSLMNEISKRLENRVQSVQRLQAFRMCITTLDEQHRMFASKWAHRFAANVGSILQRSTVAVK